MDLLALLLGKKKEAASHFAWASRDKRKTIADYQREALVKQGREQFQKLVKRGLQVPVALL